MFIIIIFIIIGYLVHPYKYDIVDNVQNRENLNNNYQGERKNYQNKQIGSKNDTENVSI